MSSRRSTLRPTSSSERLKALATATTSGHVAEDEEDEERADDDSCEDNPDIVLVQRVAVFSGEAFYHLP